MIWRIDIKLFTMHKNKIVHLSQYIRSIDIDIAK